MKRLIALALVLAAFATAAAAQTATGFTGKWQGTFTMQRPDGTEGNPNQVAFDLQWPIDKGAVEGGKASFEVQQPNGPLFKFTLAVVKGRLEGEMTGEREGVVRGRAKVEAAKAAPAK
jgi:hypothetical protein